MRTYTSRKIIIIIISYLYKTESKLWHPHCIQANRCLYTWVPGCNFEADAPLSALVRRRRTRCSGRVSIVGGFLQSCQSLTLLCLRLPIPFLGGQSHLVKIRMVVGLPHCLWICPIPSIFQVWSVMLPLGPGFLHS